MKGEIWYWGGVYFKIDLSWNRVKKIKGRGIVKGLNGERKLGYNYKIWRKVIGREVIEICCGKRVKVEESRRVFEEKWKWII